MEEGRLILLNFIQYKMIPMMDPQYLAEKYASKPSNQRNKILGGRYVKEKYLGKGGFAYCLQVTDTSNGESYAMKIIPKAVDGKKRAMDKIQNEINILSEMDHIEERYLEDDENVYIIMHLYKNKSMVELLKVRKRITEEETKCYIHQLVLGLKYIHSQNVVHRDLKLGNLFLSEKMELKIGDFGLSERISYPGELLKSMSGTPNYIAPEILINKEGHSYEVDIWAIGVITYTLIVGKPPFQSKNSKATCSRIKRLDYSFPKDIYISHEAKDFITSMLQLDPTDRPSIEEILEFSFLQGSFPDL